MQIISKNQAMSLLGKSIDESTNLKQSRYISDFETWERNVKVRTDAIFGAGSPHAKEVSTKLDEMKSNTTTTGKSREMPSIVALLRSFLTEIEELWSDAGIPPLSTLSNDDQHPQTTPRPTNNRVFVVHGHDHGRMQAIARFLEHLGLEPIILHERASSGDTIIEKLERHSEACYAVILLTPDDVGCAVADRDKLRPRARQNVILELGYFLARLGRTRTAALVVQGVEIPSDYSGIVYISIDKGDEWKLLLARELRASGLDIDMNRVL